MNKANVPNVSWHIQDVKANKGNTTQGNGAWAVPKYIFYGLNSRKGFLTFFSGSLSCLNLALPMWLKENTKGPRNWPRYAVFFFNGDSFSCRKANYFFSTTNIRRRFLILGASDNIYENKKSRRDAQSNNRRHFYFIIFELTFKTNFVVFNGYKSISQNTGNTG